MVSAKLTRVPRCKATDDVAKRAVVAVEYVRTRKVAATARRFGVTRAFVKKWGERFQNGQANKFEDAPRSGRPRKLNETQTSELLALVKDQSNKLDCARQLHNHMGLSGTVSVSTVRRTLTRLKCSYPAPKKYRRLTKEHRVKRHTFATKYHSSSPWKRCLFTDSTYIYNCQATRRWVLEGEENASEYDKWPMKLHMYAGITYHGRTPLYFATGTTSQKPYIQGPRGTRAKEYREMVVEGLFMPSALGDRLFPGGGNDWYFVQDGARPHTAVLTKDLLREIMPKNWIEDWPPNSADLNPIEHVWKMLKDRLKGINFDDVETFKDACRAAWEDIPQKDIQACVGSVGRRLRAVVSARGGYIPY